MSTAPPLSIALLGTGAMGRFLATQILTHPEMTLAAWWDGLPGSRDRFKAEFPALQDQEAHPDAWGPCGISHLIEAAHPSAVPTVLEQAASLGCSAIIASVGGLISPEGATSLEKAIAEGTRVLIPSGAIGGLDILRAIPPDQLISVALRTRKPPSALPPDQAASITAPTRLFAGTAREAIMQFPKNVNVAVTLSLAGMGADETLVEVWADPTVERNTHEIAIESTCGSYRITCANVPLEGNPGTSAIAAMSIFSILLGETKAVRVGS